LLRHALALESDSIVALGALHQLLLEQGRAVEAAVYERRLLAQRERDPYYWLGLGLDHLQQSRDAQAVRALERAQALTTGFDEVHRYLAIAYWRTGQMHRARDQLALLGALGRGDAKLAQIRYKLSLDRPPPR
jgi:predicted Zn-dependent protease